MTEYYKDCLQKGLIYQDYVTDKIQEHLGISISCYSSREYQYARGESRQGIEIKFDDRYSDTGNIYIETHERSDQAYDLVESGILRSDNTWLYLIGDYSRIYMFAKKTLLHIYHSERYHRAVQIPTSRGFLLTDDQAMRYCLLYFDSNLESWC